MASCLSHATGWDAPDLAVFCPEIPGQGTDDDHRVYTTNVAYPEVLEAFGAGQAQPGFQHDPDKSCSRPAIDQRRHAQVTCVANTAACAS
jgi:hypothetical protein